MPFVQAKFTNCGANLEVNSEHDAAVCPYCHTPESRGEYRYAIADKTND